MTVFEGKTRDAAGCDFYVVYLFIKEVFIEFLNVENFLAKLDQRILVNALIGAGIGGGAGKELVFFSRTVLTCLSAVVVSALGSLDFGREAGSTVWICT